MTLPILLYSSENNDGGRMSSALVVKEFNGYGNLPAVSVENQASGITNIRKAFVKITDISNPIITKALVYLRKENDLPDTYALLTHGTQTDIVSAMESRKYSTGKLTSDVSVLATSLSITFHPEIIADDVIKAGDTIIITNGTLTNKAVVSSTTPSANQTDIVFSPALSNSFLAADTFVASCILTENLSATIDNIDKSLLTTTTFDNAALESNSIGGIEQTITVTMLTASTFLVESDVLTELPNGSVGADYAPLNPAFFEPYFRINSSGWGGTSVANESFSFQTHPAAIPVFVSHITDAGATGGNDLIYLASAIEA